MRDKARQEQPTLDEIRHSLAHLLAAAVLKLFHGTKLGIGPTIENGFYYDFLFTKPLTPETLPKLEELMRDYIRAALPFSGKKITPAAAKKLFAKQPFKLDLIKEFAEEKKQLTAFRTGDIFEDLCRGGHVKNTNEIDPGSFKLTHLAGAYWRGSEKNPMLTRIYGVAFSTKQELDAYLKMQEEAKKRDHRELGKRLKLFMFDDLVGPGLPLWLPNGVIVKDELEKFAKETEEQWGYKRIATPHIAKEQLFRTSGHLPYYADSMFPPMKLDDGNYYLKAMNCPFAHLIYRAEPRSYRDLPLRFAEYGTVYRNELSGTLAGLLRVRMLSMNDAHIYCRKDQIEEEFKKVIEMTLYYFGVFGLKNYSFRLSTWDPKHKEKYAGEPKHWKFAEETIASTLKKLGVPFTEAKNEAAFYGPKVDVQYKSVIGREETMSTIQLDFLAKERFKLAYHDKDGKENSEVFVIHRAPLSTHERFIAYLLEHYAGAFPLWLAPVQARILPISEKFLDYGKKVYEKLRAEGIRVELDSASETLGKRIRQAELEKIPYVLVVGEKEQTNGTANIRSREKGNEGELELLALVKQLAREITEKK